MKQWRVNHSGGPEATSILKALFPISKVMGVFGDICPQKILANWIFVSGALEARGRLKLLQANSSLRMNLDWKRWHNR